MLGEQANSATEDLRDAMNDPSPSVVVVASEALYNLGDKTLARSGLTKVLKADNSYARAHALNTIDSIGEATKAIKEAVNDMAQEAGVLTSQHYDHPVAKVLLDKWDVDAEEYGIETEW